MERKKLSTIENWLKDAYPTEDIVQLSHVYGDGPILDVGLGNPEKVFESPDPYIVTERVYEVLDKLRTGKKTTPQSRSLPRQK